MDSTRNKRTFECDKPFLFGMWNTSWKFEGFFSAFFRAPFNTFFPLHQLPQRFLWFKRIPGSHLRCMPVLWLRLLDKPKWITFSFLFSIVNNVFRVGGGKSNTLTFMYVMKWPHYCLTMAIGFMVFAHMDGDLKFFTRFHCVNCAGSICGSYWNLIAKLQAMVPIAKSMLSRLMSESESIASGTFHYGLNGFTDDIRGGLSNHLFGKSISISHRLSLNKIVFADRIF